MNVEYKVIKEIVLTMSEKEAKWLQSYLQNYLGKDDEPFDSKQMREKLWTAFEEISFKE